MLISVLPPFYFGCEKKLNLIEFFFHIHFRVCKKIWLCSNECCSLEWFVFFTFFKLTVLGKNRENPWKICFCYKYNSCIGNEKQQGFVLDLVSTL